MLDIFVGDDVYFIFIVLSRIVYWIQGVMAYECPKKYLMALVYEVISVDSCSVVWGNCPPKDSSHHLSDMHQLALQPLQDQVSP